MPERDEGLDSVAEIDVCGFADRWGPEKVIQVYDWKTGMKGTLVIDNTTLGPGKGGIRFLATVTPMEVFRLARTMTWKCAINQLPFGGAKSGIQGDPDKVDKVAWLRAFARAVSPYVPSQYVAAPDMGTGKDEMVIFADEIGDVMACTGKPTEFGGIPHELGTTGYGVALAASEAATVLKELKQGTLDIRNSRVTIQGFGCVGSYSAKFLYDMGAKITAVNDVTSTIYDPNGFDVNRLLKDMQKARTLDNLEGVQHFPCEEIFKIRSDIFVPAATADTINSETARRLADAEVKLVVEGANIPTTRDAEAYLSENEVCIVPDFVANAGGLVGSFAEYIRTTERIAFDMIKDKIVRNVRQVLTESLVSNRIPREVGMEIAQKRLRKAMKLRRTVSSKMPNSDPTT